MAYRNYAQVPPTAATIALNAYIFGYGGHSLVTPHAALKMMWWTEERIAAKVTRSFVLSKLRGEERGFLDRPLAFGEGLTDDTYMEWILGRAKRLFLILTVVGVPDQIFGCIDDSWDDSDLPISLESVQNLELSYDNDEALNQRFYDLQFVYLLRELKQGAHIDYGPKEHIPMEYINSLPPAVSLQVWDRIHFPERPDNVFMRRKYPLSDRDTGQQHREMFMRDVRRAKTLTHAHIAPTWGSYTSEDSGFTISDFVAEHTLSTFIDHRTPTQFMRVPAAERPALLCEWMHCLADALASLHHRGVAHTAIRPSNIWIDRDNRIAFADIGTLQTFQRGKKAHRTEAYDYAAPESQLCKTPLSLPSSSPPISSMSAFSKLRKMSTSTSSSSTGSSGGSSTRSNSICLVAPSLPTPQSTSHRDGSTTTLPASPSTTARSSRSLRNFGRHGSRPTSGDTSHPRPSITFPRPTYIDPDTLTDLPAAAPEMSDVFSLGCIYFDILTFLLCGRTTDFLRFRSSRIAQPGRRARVDGSFHAELGRVEEWIDLLEGESCKRSEGVFRGVPALLGVVRRMLGQNGTLRPTAMEVRERVLEVLVGECGVSRLCCAGREWESGEVEEEESPFRRGGCVLDSGLMIPPPEDVNCGAVEEGSVFEEEDGGKRERRRSSASAATARLGSWRRALFRG